jgi:hypothetical protein
MKKFHEAISKFAVAVAGVMLLAALLRPLLPCLFAVLVLTWVFTVLRRDL